MAWSAVFVVWSVATFALDYDLLLMVRRLAGDHGGLAVALAIGVPLLIDASRNAQRGYRLWRRRVVQRPASATWSDRVPASTPRTFRGGAMLTRRERAIVEQGQLAYGRVEHHGELVSVRYVAPWGQSIASHPVVGTRRPAEGTRAPLLLEQGALVGVAPSLLDLEFLAAAPEDRRPHVSTTSERERTIPATKLSIQVHASLHPVVRTSGSKPSEVGELSYDGGRLTLIHPAAEPLSVRLDRPLRVELSVLLLPGGMAELNASIEQQPSGAYRAAESHRIRFKTELAQLHLDRNLEQAWIDACYLSASDFESLWWLIVEAAGDDALARSLSFGGAPKKRQP
jgi:hypothetical protein